MNDNDQIRLFRPILIAGLAARSITATVKASFQPRQEGAETGPTLYFYKVADHRYGSVRRSSVWDVDNQVMVYTEIEQYETTWQVTALSIQDPSDTTKPTASDLANAAAAIMQSQACIGALVAQGVGVYRVTDVRNPYFVDDKGRHEVSPSFDFVLTHEQRIISTAPVVESVECLIRRI